MTSLFQALFEPKRIALIGASADPAKTTSRPQRFLRKHGFTGEILPVNPSRSEILGEKAYKDLTSIPGDIDHAYILLNGPDAVAALAACGKRGVKVASILAGGFADAGAAGASLQDDLSRIVAETGIRLVGPNSIGTVSTDPPMALTANAAFAVDKLRAGRWAVVSQSGSLIGALLSRADARGIGFSRLISVGNEVDLAVGEIADLLVDDPRTDAILLFMETLRDGERLARAARRAHAAGKPVIAYKLGRSSIGQELAKSHTGAIAGSDATFDAFCRRHGIARVSMFESLVDVPALLVDRPPVRGKRVAVATTTGGGAAMVVDNMAMAGLDIADPPQALVDWLKPLGIAAGEGKLIDLTLAGAKPEIVAGTIERLLADDGNDAVIFVVGSSAQFNPELAVEPLLRFARSAKPFAVSLTPAAEKSLALLTAAGVPAFRHPEVLRRGDGGLPAASGAAARARVSRAAARGARRAGSRPRLGLRRAARRRPVHGAGRADGQGPRRARCQAGRRRGRRSRRAGGAKNPVGRYRTQDRGGRRGLRPARWPDGRRGGTRDREAGQGACTAGKARGLPGPEDGTRPRRGDPGFPPRSVGRADDHRRSRRRAGRDLQGRRDPVGSGRRGRSAADDRRGEGPRHHPRLPQPAARRCGGAGQDDRGLLEPWPTRLLPPCPRPRSTRCWSSARARRWWPSMGLWRCAERSVRRRSIRCLP